MKSCVVLFSGGSDSSWVAFEAAQTFDHVYLLTFHRKGFFKTKAYTTERADILKSYFGPAKISHHIVEISGKHRTLSTTNYWRNLFKFHILVGVLSFSKLAFHWAAIEFARKHGAAFVMDGGVEYMDVYPDQNKTVMQASITPLYQDFGISYSQPLSQKNMDVEAVLYAVGFNTQKNWRGTSSDKQVYYAEQVLLAHLVSVYLRHFSWSQYQKNLKDLYVEKSNFIRTQISC